MNRRIRKKVSRRYVHNHGFYLAKLIDWYSESDRFDRNNLTPENTVYYFFRQEMKNGEDLNKFIDSFKEGYVLNNQDEYEKVMRALYYCDFNTNTIDVSGPLSWLTMNALKNKLSIDSDIDYLIRKQDKDFIEIIKSLNKLYVIFFDTNYQLAHAYVDINDKSLTSVSLSFIGENYQDFEKTLSRKDQLAILELKDLFKMTESMFYYFQPISNDRCMLFIRTK